MYVANNFVFMFCLVWFFLNFYTVSVFILLQNSMSRILAAIAVCVAVECNEMEQMSVNGHSDL